jgi:hypothetical protein
MELRKEHVPLGRRTDIAGAGLTCRRFQAPLKTLGVQTSSMEVQGED